MIKTITPLAISLTTLRNLTVFILLIFGLLQFGQPTAARITSALDRWILRLGVELGSLPAQTAPLTVVHVPDIEYDKWQVDLAGAQGLVDLFEKGGLYNGTGKGPPVFYGLVLTYPLSLVRSSAENLLTEIQQSQPTLLETVYPDVKKLLVRRTQLVDILNGPQSIVGMENALPLDWPVVTMPDRRPFDQPRWFAGLLWPGLLAMDGEQLSLGAVRHAVPILPSDSLSVSLLASYDESVHPGFSLAFIQAAMAMRERGAAGSGLEWKPGVGVDLGHKRVIATDAAGRIVPLYGNAAGVRATVRQITLSAALALNDLGGWVLIGRDGSPALDQVAQQLAALADDAYLHEPLWWSPYSKLVILGLTIILLLLATFARMSHTAYAWLGCLVATALINLAGHIYGNFWFPVAWIYLYLGVLMFMLVVWRRQRIGFLRLFQRLDSVSLDYAGDLIQEDRPEQAFRVLRHCRTSGELLQKLYTLAETQIEKSQPVEAMHILREIRRRRRRYRDVQAKIAALEPVVQRAEEEQSSAGVETGGELPMAGTAVGKQPVLAKTQLLRAVVSPLRRTLGRYEIQEEIGRGAFGTVYRAFDPHIARQVAIKTLNYVTAESENRRELKERFFREAQAAGRLSHPHIVHVYDVGEQDQLAYIAMDYARGKPLSAYVQPETLLPIVDVYRIIMNVAEALAFAHSHNVIHRDIKPGNIILNQQPYQLKVTDFGIARITDFAQTSTGEILGSPLYMAPEQLLGKRAGPQADIFSLGVMFYQLASGQLPFNGDNLASLSYDVIHTKHKSVRSVRRELPSSATRITNRALQKKPADRYESAADMAEAVRRALNKDFNGALKESSRSRMGDPA